jgi:hypothetical protein
MTMTRNNVHEPDESDVRHVAGRHLHATRAMAWGHPGRASQPPADPATPVTIERALAAAAKDPDQVTDLLDELSRGRLWLPLPEARPVTDGSAVLDVTFPGENEPDQVDA